MGDLTRLPELHLEASSGWQAYELLDSGNGETLERVGPYRLIRPEPQAIWPKGLPAKEWQDADAVMISTGGEAGGDWKVKQTVRQPWVIDYQGLKCEIRLARSRHIGVFPEQASHWDWIAEQVRSSKRSLKVINLFGYTGMATAAAARAGAQVTHVDASKHAIAWASHNLELSGLGQASVRWLVEDARKYLQRESKRKSFYDGIILDPPKFGRGPGGRIWDYFKDIAGLLALCKQVLSPNPSFICLTSYAIQASALVPHQALQETVKGLGGSISSGELVTVDKSQGHILSHSLFSRWSAD